MAFQLNVISSIENVRHSVVAIILTALHIVLPHSDIPNYPESKRHIFPICAGIISRKSYSRSSLAVCNSIIFRRTAYVGIPVISTSIYLYTRCVTVESTDTQMYDIRMTYLPLQSSTTCTVCVYLVVLCYWTRNKTQREPETSESKNHMHIVRLLSKSRLK